MKTYYALEPGFKADLTLRMKIEMEFDRIPAFHGNMRTNGMEIGNFEVVSKTYPVKLFARNKV